jgi:hypothetical protein
MKSNKIILLGFFLFVLSALGQVYTNKVVGKKNQDLIDSLKITEYPYALPIWGEKVAQKGYNLPYSAGLGINYFWQKSDLTIDNLNIGFNNGPMHNLDQVVRFNDAVAEASAFNIRPDIWLLPFLNIYGIFGKGRTSTSIGAGIWVPDGDNNWSEVYSFNTKADFDITTMGFGMTPTIGVAGGWFALDMNMAWSDVSALEKPAFSFIFGPRLGKTFKLNKPESNIAIWAGGFRVHLKSETKGSLPLSDFLSLDGAQSRVDAGLANVADKQVSVDNWWNGLSPLEQANPANIARYGAANNALDAAGGFLTTLDGALSTAGSSTVQYSLEKAPADKWNFIVGTQYQFNKHWMFRAEYGFLGTRNQFIGGLQYRFGL